MTFFATQNPGIGGLDELTINEQTTVQTIASLGTPGYFLRTNLAGTAVEWAIGGGGTGDVVGPASATDNAVARFDATTGKLLQNSSATISDNGDLVIGNSTGNRGITINSGSTRISTITQNGAGAADPLRIGTNGSMTLEVDSTPVMTISDTGPVTFAQTVAVPDDAFASSWNGSANVPTKNAVYDQIILKSSALYVTVGDSTTNFPVASYADIGAAINAAYASLPTDGGTIFIQNGTYSYTTPIVFGTNAKIASLIGASAAGTILKYTPTSGNAITVNHGDTSGRHRQHEVAHFTMMGTSTFVYVGTVNTRTSVGLFLGGANGCPAISVHDMTINGFGTQIETSSNFYMGSIRSVALSGGNGVNGTGTGLQGSLVHINSYSNSGERIVFSDCSFSDPCNSAAGNAIYVESSGSASLVFDGCSLDNSQLRVIGSTMTTFTNGHIENPTSSVYNRYIPIYLDDYQYGTFIFQNNEIVDDGTVAGKNFDKIIYHGINLIASGTHISNFSGQTMTTAFDNSLYAPSSSQHITGTIVESGTLTNISYGWPYTQAKGVGSHQDFQGGYPTGLVANADSTVNWKVGNNISALTSDATGNLTAMGTVTANTGFIPDANDGAYLGTSALSFSDLFLATGGIVNWANGDMLITHGTGVLTVSNTAPGVIGPIVEIYQDSASPAVNDAIGSIDFYGRDSAANKQYYAGVRASINSATSTAETGILEFLTVQSGTAASRSQMSGNAFSPTANDGIALGGAVNNWSDLFLATGAVINFNNSNTVLTHSSGVLTLGTGTLKITTPTNNSTSVLTTDATQTLTNKRVTKRTATTNAPGATPTTNTDNVDLQIFTGLATAVTSMTTNLSGTPVTGDLLRFWLTDNGTARAITWGASFAASGTVALPTTTVISTTLTVGFEWTGSVWRCIAVA